MSRSDADYWNELSRKLGTDPNHLRDEFTRQFTAIACPTLTPEQMDEGDMTEERP